ncbi:MAG: cobaltochelatase subunit CobN, partial [Caldimicrobium sp.]
LEVIRKGYWKPEKEITEKLVLEYVKSVEEVGLACCDHTCNNPLLTKFTAQVLSSIPGLKQELQKFLKASKEIQEGKKDAQRDTNKKGNRERKNLVPTLNGKVVEGYEVEETNMNLIRASSAPIPYLFLIGFFLFLSIIAYGFRKKP